MIEAIRVWVTGQVQGVSYRYYTVLAAERIGIKGWVKNLPDGRVEAWFEGTPEQVQSMVQWCWEGSPLARIDLVQTQVETPADYRKFDVLR